MKESILATAAAVICAGALIAAQSPGTPVSPTNPAGARPGTQADEVRSGERGTTMLTGCVYREESVPGRSPNIAERAGILEDFILVVSMAPETAGENRGVGTSGQVGTPGQSDAPAPGAGQERVDASPDRQDSGVTGTSGRLAARRSMYKLEHADDDELQSFVGKRVEVIGRIDAEADDTTASAQPFEVSSIREIGGECPATPQVNQ